MQRTCTLAVVPGLRERKKQQTREVIVRTAMELFAARGYARTTVADIAEAADIAPRTFFAYFPTKEDVVFHDRDEALASLVARIRGRVEGEPAFAALRAWILAVDAEAGWERPEERARRRLIRGTPALAARERADLAQLEGLLAEAVADDLGVAPGSLRPHLVSAAAVAALDAIARRRDEEDPEPGAGSAADVLDEALVFLSGGLDALKRRRPPTTP